MRGDQNKTWRNIIKQAAKLARPPSVPAQVGELINLTKNGNNTPAFTRYSAILRAQKPPFQPNKYEPGRYHTESKI